MITDSETLVSFEGMTNSTKYTEILRRRIVYWGKRLAGYFDLTHCRNSKLIKNFKLQNQINVLDLPGNSPDWNPIENLQDILKRRLGKMNCTTKECVLTSALNELFYGDEVQNT